MGWRLAYSLETLRKQLNEAYPGRDKTSDGTIGDTSHSHTASDHNLNAQGVVCAMDIDNDLSDNFSAHDLAEIMRVNRHPDLKYIISKDRICSARDNWVWRKYTGYRHDKHIHVSVGVGRDGQSKQPYDDKDLWVVDLQQDGGNMSKEGLTKEEVIELHMAYRGGSVPGANYDYRHVGGTLEQFIHDFKPAQVGNVDCDSKIDSIFEGVKKAFGK